MQRERWVSHLRVITSSDTGRLRCLISGFHRHHLLPQRVGLPLQVLQNALAVLLFRGVLTGIDRGRAVLEPTVDQAGHLMRRGRNGLGCAQAGFLAPAIRPSRTPTVVPPLGCPP